MKHQTIHATLARSYLAYFVASILGLSADTFLGITIRVAHAALIAVAAFVLGGLLIWWAQFTSRISRTDSKKPYFLRGPYRYLRNPTHLGLVLLVVGYTVVSGSVMFCAVTLVGYLISNIFFRKYESQLAKEYDGAYESYQSSVPKIL